MSEDTKKVEKIEQDAKVEETEQKTEASELSAQDLDKVAGGLGGSHGDTQIVEPPDHLRANWRR